MGKRNRKSKRKQKQEEQPPRQAPSNDQAFSVLSEVEKLRLTEETAIRTYANALQLSRQNGFRPIDFAFDIDPLIQADPALMAKFQETIMVLASQASGAPVDPHDAHQTAQLFANGSIAGVGLDQGGLTVLEGPPDLPDAVRQRQELAKKSATHQEHARQLLREHPDATKHLIAGVHRFQNLINMDHHALQALLTETEQRLAEETAPRPGYEPAAEPDSPPPRLSQQDEAALMSALQNLSLVAHTDATVPPPPGHDDTESDGWEFMGYPGSEGP